MSIEGLVYFDGGVLETEPELHAEYNEIVLYQGSELPGIGFVVQNTTRFASGYDILGNMVSVSVSGTVVFVNRAIELTTRRTLDPDYPDDDPVMIVWFTSSDVFTAGIYELQMRAINQTAVSAVEYFPVVTVRILGSIA